MHVIAHLYAIVGGVKIFIAAFILPISIMGSIPILSRIISPEAGYVKTINTIKAIIHNNIIGNTILQYTVDVYLTPRCLLSVILYT